MLKQQMGIKDSCIFGQNNSQVKSILFSANSQQNFSYYTYKVGIDHTP